MKKILFTIIVLSTGALVRAQNINDHSGINQERLINASGLNFAVSISPGLSVGNTGSKFVLGAELSLFKNITSNLEATGSVGITRFFYNLKDIQNEMLISVAPGIRYHLNKFYIEGKVGVALSTTDGGAYFLYSPGAGFKVTKQFEVGLNFDRFSNRSSVLGLNLTYKIRQ